MRLFLRRKQEKASGARPSGKRRKRSVRAEDDSVFRELLFFYTEHGYSIQHRLDRKRQDCESYAVKAISELDISGAIISCDILDNPETFMDAVFSRGADFLMALEETQSPMYERMLERFDMYKEAGERENRSFSIAACSNRRTSDRDEILRINMVPSGSFMGHPPLPGMELGCLVKATLQTTDKTQGKGESSERIRYYMTSLRNNRSYYPLDIILSLIRQHWLDERDPRWVLNISFSHDSRYCRMGEYSLGEKILNGIASDIRKKLPCGMVQALKEETGESDPDAFVHDVLSLLKQ